MIRRIVLVLALGFVLSLQAPVSAQGMVPGGWATQFGYQAVAGPGVAAFGASAGYSYGMPGYGYGGWGYGGMNPYGTGFGMGYPQGIGMTSGFSNGVVYAPPPAQATTAMNPLIDSVRQVTKRRKAAAETNRARDRPDEPDAPRLEPVSLPPQHGANPAVDCGASW